MRLSENWLREYVSPPLTTGQLAHQLTMAGLEVESVSPAAGSFSGVIVAEVLEAEPHPAADKLRVCRVNNGREVIQIVCGAPNVRAGIRVPLAEIGAELPDALKIKAASLRGVDSSGMLCSAKELAIDEDASGLMELPADAPIGEDLRRYLGLDDTLIELNLTPNRADCLSVEGIAREVALLNGLSLTEPQSGLTEILETRTYPVEVENFDYCPKYLGQIVLGVDRTAATPLWMRERLRRAGIRSIDLIVDVTNYVLIEMGQPLHAFDLDRLEGPVRIRLARSGEKLLLLNGQDVELDSQTLVIADDRGPLALAGIMGGRESAVSDQTTNLFVESAFFSPDGIMGRARRYGLSTDSSHRFERGVGFELQERALERAVSLIKTYAGGRVGPVVSRVSSDHLPVRAPLKIRFQRLEKTLGLEFSVERVQEILQGLGMNPKETPDGFEVTPPSVRFDIALEADLIEEIARVHGYDQLPRRSPKIPAAMRPVSERELTIDRIKDLLVDRGYQEAITYSFVGSEIQQIVDPGIAPLALKNPLSAELAVMRTSLWPGLLDAALKNQSRQQDRIRLFESGLRFLPGTDSLDQRKTLAFLATGSVVREQWGLQGKAVDFFDVKADIEALVALTGRCEAFRFRAAAHPALHPGQSAEILNGENAFGWIGQLHPRIEQKLGFEKPVFLVSLDLDALIVRQLPRFLGLSKYPSVRRDMALCVEEATPVQRLVDTAKQHAGDLLRDILVFDVYRGPGLEPGIKSVALGLVWQNELETLVDEQVDAYFGAVMDALKLECGARLRD